MKWVAAAIYQIKQKLRSFTDYSMDASEYFYFLWKGIFTHLMTGFEI